MLRGRLVIGLVLLAALPLAPSASAALPSVEVATWSSVGVVPDAPEGGVYVAASATGPLAVSAVRVRAERAGAARLVLPVHRVVPVDGVVLALLPTTSSWRPGAWQEWANRPAFDQQLVPVVGVRQGAVVTFDLGTMSQGEVRRLLLRPIRPDRLRPEIPNEGPTQTFSAAFGTPSLRLTTTGRSAARVERLPVRPVTQQPGPELLRAPAPRAPQLENAPGGVWRAEPLLVSGAAAYRRGEYLWQGYLYDDHGAAGSVDPGDVILNNFLFAAKSGTLTYPTDKRFVHNAADILEIRVRPLAAATAFRVSFTSLVDPERTAFTLALGGSPSSVTWPFTAGVQSPARLFATVHGSTVTLTSATGARLRGGSVRVDALRHQYDVRVPHSVWDPGRSRQRVAVGAGLWDVGAGRYLAPAPVSSTTQPGGVSSSGAALFDMGPRFDEPMPDWSRMGLATTIADSAVVMQADQKCFWRECRQAAALASGDVSPLHAVVDFGTLARGSTDDSGVPRSGFLNRVHASRFSAGQGIDPARACGRFPVSCTGMFVGNLQPYEVYLPPRRAPKAGWGLAVMLHASGANHNERMGSRMQQQIAGRGSGSIMVTPLARDPDGDYTDGTEADVFEAWADALRHYPVDRSRTVVVGYSMGGGGTYKMVQRWPDLFAAGFGAAAAPYEDGWEGQWFPGRRNVPILTWIGTQDEATGPTSQDGIKQLNERYGFGYELRQFLTSDHLTIATNDQYAEGAAWLGDRRVVPDPHRVSLVVDRRSDYPKRRLVADHAYWLSGLVVHRHPAGVVEATSLGFGVGDRAVRLSTDHGVMTGGYKGPMPWVSTTQRLGSVVRVPRADHLDLQVRNLSSVTVDVRRARLSCRAIVTVRTDVPVRVVFPQCGLAVVAPAGTSSVRLPTTR